MQFAEEKPLKTFYPEKFKLLNKVLKFNAFYKEGTIFDNPNEFYRIRKLLIHFYLEDNTIEIINPKQENSGIVGGLWLNKDKYMFPGQNRYY